MTEQATTIADVKAAALADYRKVVEAKAKGEPFDPYDALETFRILGKTEADADADADRVRDREKWAEAVRAAEKVKPEFREAHQRLAAATAEKGERIAAVARECDGKIATAKAETDRTRRIIEAGEKAAEKLRGTAPPGVRAVQEDIRERLGVALRRLRAATDAERIAAADLNAAKRAAELDLDERPKEAAELVEAAERRLADARADLAAAEADRASLDAEKTAARDLALEPWPADCPALRSDD